MTLHPFLTFSPFSLPSLTPLPSLLSSNLNHLINPQSIISLFLLFPSLTPPLSFPSLLFPLSLSLPSLHFIYFSPSPLSLFPPSPLFSLSFLSLSLAPFSTVLLLFCNGGHHWHSSLHSPQLDHQISHQCHSPHHLPRHHLLLPGLPL